MNNPYAILCIKPTATDDEIKMAWKNQIDTFCLGNENSNTELLRKIFTNAAESLLNKEEKAKIDKELTGNVNMYLRQMLGITLNSGLDNSSDVNSQSKSLENGYVIIGEDGSCLLAYYRVEDWTDINDVFYRQHCLKDLLTGQHYSCITYSDSCYNIRVENSKKLFTSPSWKTGDCIEVLGVKSKVVPIMKLIPMEMIKGTRASEYDLRRFISALEMILSSEPEILTCLFDPNSKKKTLSVKL